MGDQVQSAAGFLDKKDAERLCHRKLKRLSSCTLYKKVLVKNTLKFVQSSQDEDIPFQKEDYEPRSKMKYDEDDLINDVSEILNEMIFPQSFLPSPEEFSFDWPETSVCEQNDAAIVPDVEIIEDEVDQHFLNTIFSDRTNVTITKISNSRCDVAKNDSADNYRTSPGKQFSRSPSSELKIIKPEITLIPACSIQILINDLDKY